MKRRKSSEDNPCSRCDAIVPAWQGYYQLQGDELISLHVECAVAQQAELRRHEAEASQLRREMLANERRHEAIKSRCVSQCD